MADEKAELDRIPATDEALVVRPDYRGNGRGSDAFEYGYGPDENEDLHLRSLWRIVLKRKWLVISVTLIITILVALQVFGRKSVYQASTVIKIDKENSTVLRIGDVTLQADDSDTINTDILILKSTSLLEDMVVELNLDKNPRLVEPSGKSAWTVIKDIGSGKSPVADNLNRGEALRQAPPVVSDQLGRLEPRSRQESERLAPYVRVVQTNLVIEPIEDTRAVRISFTHTDPAIAALVANGLADRFKRYNFENKTEKFTNTSDWLQRSTRELQGKVQNAEQQLANYSGQHNIFSTEGKETLSSEKLTKLHDLSMRAATDRLLKQSLYEEVKQGRVAQLPEAFVDPRIGDLQKKLSELSISSAQVTAEYGPQNPRVVELKQQIAAIQEQITESRRGLEDKLKAEYERAVRDEKSFDQAFAQAKQEAVQQNQAAIQYNILKQDVDTSRSLYTDFLQKTNQTNLQVAEQHNNVRVIEPAEVPAGPIGPNRPRSILIAFLLSLAAGVGLVFFLEYLDNTVKSSEDVMRYAQLPVLGVIPTITLGPWHKRSFRKSKNNGHLLPESTEADVGIKLHNGSSKLIALDARSFAAESYRGLRTSVLMSTAGRRPKKILVTSGQPGEGKTTTVINTALSLAQLGASVLIIDCDLRKPTAHKAFDVDYSRGLSLYLSSDEKVEGLIQALDKPNLWLLPCGPPPPNPAELISSDRMKEMLRIVSDKYDHILIDSPPLMNVVDSVIISTLVDGVILVVHGGKSTRDVLRRSRQELSNVGAKIFGVVLNNMDMRENDYYYYYRSGDY
ncbi:MAG TPA: polysaccharide biosynthesis tyrosine autokinase [Pyrinomonadaceae bacterium]|nr:polysaccharide biosynthesis tyrosine autokinase [Pyrinomonadaceae bacterium]